MTRRQRTEGTGAAVPRGESVRVNVLRQQRHRAPLRIVVPAIAVPAVAAVVVFLGEGRPGSAAVPADYPIFLDLLFWGMAVVAAAAMLESTRDALRDAEEIGGATATWTFRVAALAPRPVVVVASGAAGAVMVQGLIVASGAQEFLPYWSMNTLFGAAHGIFLPIAVGYVGSVWGLARVVERAEWPLVEVGLERTRRNLLRITGFALGLLILDATILYATSFFESGLAMVAWLLYALVSILVASAGLTLLGRLRSARSESRWREYGSLLTRYHAASRAFLDKPAEEGKLELEGIVALMERHERSDHWPFAAPGRDAVLFPALLAIVGSGIQLLLPLLLAGDAA